METAKERYATARAFRVAIADRLKRLAQESGEPYLDLYREVAIDRFLARVDWSAWTAKGGFALQRRLPKARRTKDIDLATEVGNVNYRILYFFHGKDCVVLTHGITKKAKIPDSEINRAIAMKDNYQKNPDKHTYYEAEQYYEEGT